MHTDHVETHVISSILHVGRDVDEPWPIVIEGFDGRTHEVDLQPGQMLLYESAKCAHGRPRKMKGRWYTSLFVHYKPTREWNWSVKEAIRRIEQSMETKEYLAGGWGMPADPVDHSVPELRMRGTGMFEPDCDHEWCSLSKDWPQGHIPEEDSEEEDDDEEDAGDDNDVPDDLDDEDDLDDMDESDL